MAKSRLRTLSSVEVTRYAGGNETIDRLMEDEVLWIVQGPSGRRPVIADTAEEASIYYVDTFYLPLEDEEDDEEELLQDCG